jgi:hypothetical protein
LPPDETVGEVKDMFLKSKVWLGSYIFICIESVLHTPIKNKNNKKRSYLYQQVLLLGVEWRGREEHSNILY